MNRVIAKLNNALNSDYSMQQEILSGSKDFKENKYRFEVSQFELKHDFKLISDDEEFTCSTEYKYFIYDNLTDNESIFVATIYHENYDDIKEIDSDFIVINFANGLKNGFINPAHV